MSILDDYANMSAQSAARPVLRHFAGVNTEVLADATEGSAILVSYADIRLKTGGTSSFWRRVLKPRLEEGAYRRVILDSGAYAVRRSGIAIDLDEYILFLQEHGHLFDEIVGLDVIGDAAATEANLDRMRDAELDPMPVFHQDEDWAGLARMLCETTGTIGVGFARLADGSGRMKYGKKVNARWLREFFRRVGTRAVHGMAMNAFNAFPFFSTDSTSWRNEGSSLRNVFEGAVESTHGIGGALAKMLGRRPRVECFRMAVRSYAGDGPELCPEMVERDSKGQARTLLRRLARRMVT